MACPDRLPSHPPAVGGEDEWHRLVVSVQEEEARVADDGNAILVELPDGIAGEAKAEAAGEAVLPPRFFEETGQGRSSES